MITIVYSNRSLEVKSKNAGFFSTVDGSVQKKLVYVCFKENQPMIDTRDWREVEAEPFLGLRDEHVVQTVSQTVAFHPSHWP